MHYLFIYLRNVNKLIRFFLFSLDNCDPYAIISLDHKEQARTRTIWNTKEPVWDQDFLL